MRRIKSEERNCIAPSVDRRTRLLDLYQLFPFERHPYWCAVIAGELSYGQVIQAEVQHWIRTRAGQALRKSAVTEAQVISPKIFEELLETYLEECTSERGPSHLELIQRLVVTGGFPEDELPNATPTPGNAAAMAMYRDISARGAGCHMLGAGAVEYYYSQLSPRVYQAYTTKYGMTDAQAETYRVHGPMDRVHAERAFAIVEDAARVHGWPSVEISVRDAFVATSLHYDGMLQAATGRIEYWDGRK